MPDEYKEEDVERIRASGEVARRCIILYTVVAAGHDEPRTKLVAWLQREGLWDSVSPQEAQFLLSESPTRQQRANGTWRAEALFPLLWSLGIIAELPSPIRCCDMQLVKSVLAPLFGSVANFVSSARLRDEAEIRTASEEIYQIHWRVRDAQLRAYPKTMMDVIEW